MNNKKVLYIYLTVKTSGCEKGVQSPVQLLYKTLVVLTIATATTPGSRWMSVCVFVLREIHKKVKEVDDWKGSIQNRAEREW